MTGKIRKLANSTIDKIAAGEVIEGPASVVKELVENAIDAKACNVTIEISGGGYQRIRISDDGEGMSREDALICCERHATSKLRTVQDLSHIHSMGFRGEALSSIASVSKFSLITKHREAKEEAPATKLTIRSQLKLQDDVRKRGTTIDIESLFYNVPARKKFQKTASASTSEITKIVTRLSLAYPNVTFRLLSDGNEVLHALASRSGAFEEHLALRIRDVLPSNYVERGCRVSYEDDLVKIHGMVGLPSDGKANRSGQYLFINCRSVTSPKISLAVQDAFATRLQMRDHPIFVLHIEVDPAIVDVNVHPQKKEVRLSHEREIMNGVKKGVLKALLKHEQPAVASVESIDFSALEVKESFAPFNEMAFQEQKVEQVNLFEVAPEVRLKVIGYYGDIALCDGASFNEAFPAHALEPGLLLIDRRAVARRLSYDTILKGLNGEGQTLAIQAMLFPITIEMTKGDAQIARRHLDLFESMGIVMREFGSDCFIIESLAAFYQQDRVEELVSEVLSGMDKVSIKMKEIAALASNHVERVESDLHRQVEELLQTRAPFLSPSGQATIAHVTDSELKRLFMENPCRKRG